MSFETKIFAGVIAFHCRFLKLRYYGEGFCTRKLINESYISFPPHQVAHHQEEGEIMNTHLVIFSILKFIIFNCVLYCVVNYKVPWLSGCSYIPGSISVILLKCPHRYFLPMWLGKIVINIINLTHAIHFASPRGLLCSLYFFTIVRIDTPTITSRWMTLFLFERTIRFAFVNK